MIAIEADQAFDGERRLPGGAAVLVEGDRIVGVQERGACLPADCERLEFPGTLLPGLIDTHVHLCGDGAPEALERLAGTSDEQTPAIIEAALRRHLHAGVTTVRDLGDLRWAVLRWRAGAADGWPTVLASGPPITSRGGHCWNMGGEVTTDAELRAAVRERAERRADVVKIMASGGLMTPGTDWARPQFSREQLAIAVQEAHAAGLALVAHAHALEAIRAALDAGVDAIEHCSFAAVGGVDADGAVVEELVRRQIPVCPTLGFQHGTSPPAAVLELMRRTGMDYDARLRFVAGLHRAGVRLVAGSDGGINGAKQHGVLPESLIHLAAAGVATDAVLATATSIAADACGLTGRKGRLAAGSDADLLVLAGDPFSGIEAVRDVTAVFLRGRWMR